MDLYRVSELHDDDKPYLEFVRSPDLSAGVYRLAAGSTDPQQPHREDEIYYVISGRARFISGGSDVSVAAGDVLFVPAGEAHRFYDIVADMVSLVFFGPAEGTRLR
jgi:mannose-6-phosphate isomerase-like protein (cupin superfamily)